MLINFYKNKNGVAMLLVVIILTAAALIVASSVLFQGLGELDMGYTYQCGEESFAAVDGCVEDALQRLKIDSGYTGGTLALGNGNCIIGVSGILPNKVIMATSTVGSCVKRLQTNVTINSGSITINSWLEK